MGPILGYVGVGGLDFFGTEGSLRNVCVLILILIFNILLITAFEYSFLMNKGKWGFMYLRRYFMRNVCILIFNILSNVFLIIRNIERCLSKEVDIVK